MKNTNPQTRISLLIISFYLIVFSGFSQTGGDAIIYPESYIGKKIEYFFFDIKGNANGVNTTTKATNYFLLDDMNGIRVSIYGNDTHPAHPSEGVVDASIYTNMINSIKKAKTARTGKDFYVFASKKLNGQTSFPAWTKDENGVIVSEYVKMLADYFQFMKDNGITIDYLAIQNEEAYNEGNITPAKHKAIIDSMRLVTDRLGVKMPLIVGYEGYGPRYLNWMQELSDSNWIDRMDIYGTHYYPAYRPLTKLKVDLGYADAANIPFWSTEPHWDNKSSVDDWEEAEKGMCAFWDQIEVGMNGFMWWAYSRSGSLRGNLMRATSVPLKGAQMIDMDDIDGKSTTKYGKLQTRSFRKGNKITVYAINNNTLNSYSNYGFNLSQGSIVGNVSFTQWIKDGSITGTLGSAIIESNNKFKLTLPTESITVISFTIDTETAISKNIVSTRLIVDSQDNTLLKIAGVPNGSDFQIFNLQGKLLGSYTNNHINISHFQRGVYLLRTSYGENIKFVKQ